VVLVPDLSTGSTVVGLRLRADTTDESLKWDVSRVAFLDKDNKEVKPQDYGCKVVSSGFDNGLQRFGALGKLGWGPQNAFENNRASWRGNPSKNQPDQQGGNQFFFVGFDACSTALPRPALVTLQQGRHFASTVTVQRHSSQGAWQDIAYAHQQPSSFNSIRIQESSMSTCTPDLCQVCQRCFKDAKGKLTNCVKKHVKDQEGQHGKGSHLCFNPDVHGCGNLLGDCNTIDTFGCYYKLMCQHDDVCETWKNQEPGCQMSSTEQSARAVSLSSSGEVVELQDAMRTNESMSNSLDGALQGKCAM